MPDMVGIDFIFGIVTGVFRGLMMFVSVAWSFRQFKERYTASFTELVALYGPLLVVAGALYIAN